MAFRDDREALIAHIEALEQELKEAREELSRAQAQLAAKDQELEDVRSGREDARKRAERDRKRAARASQVRSKVPYVAVAGCVLAGGFLYWLSTMPQRDYEIASERGVRPYGDYGPSTPVPPEPPPQPEPPPPVIDLVGAVAEASPEAPVEVGDSCIVHASSTGVGSCKASVRCGSTELFAVDDRHGFVPCARLSDEGPSTLDERTDDGDPMLTFDQTGGEVVVRADDWQVRVIVAVLPATP